MKFHEAIRQLSTNDVYEELERFAHAVGIDWENELKFVARVVVADPERAPASIGSNSDSAQEALRKWVKAFAAGKASRPSVRRSQYPGTMPDPIIESIISARLGHLSSEDLGTITGGHRLAMSAENILGYFLEEYLDTHLKSQGWVCAWGSTVKSVDFVHKDGRLLQIKNRSNSENSSSKSVRNETSILKWHRINAKDQSCYWNDLNKLCGLQTLSEKGFEDFVKNTLAANPSALAVEADNSWNLN